MFEFQLQFLKDFSIAYTYFAANLQNNKILKINQKAYKTYFFILKDTNNYLYKRRDLTKLMYSGMYNHIINHPSLIRHGGLHESTQLKKAFLKFEQ